MEKNAFGCAPQLLNPYPIYLTVGMKNITGIYPFPFVFIHFAVQYNSSICVLISWRKCGVSARLNTK
ncbi:hypothetical protein Y032_0258g458 [Ancylostoma ceylanicum]|uniref:Uncharacterized protein n=1 Tax=Ancylostoma ceylanicum TaxID=53326 RepID=A0A016SAT7_9BILA|nr:hypothetical protein Y032_0258g458 [Ancylostoma ceylanicum]